MNPLEQRLHHVRQRLQAAARAAGRAPEAIQLVAVSKTQPAAALAAAYRCGQRHFGENYLQEALEKQARLGHCAITWHFIGPIQSNKTRPIAEHFHWVHSVDRLKIAQRLSEQRPGDLPPLNVCLQVNISGEDSKSGAEPAALAELAAAVAALPRLRLRGLMCIPAPCDDPLRQRRPFAALRELRQSLPVAGLDTLSMGMTDDLEAAVAEGATILRIGTAIFGSRA
jgi:pyridoxal phosphate enzyme (YggS family)